MELVTDTVGTDTAEGVRVVRLRIPAKPEYIALARLALTGLAQTRELDSETIGDLKLALTEAVSNSVRHAYGTAGEGQVDIRYELRSDRISVDVLDDGAGFDPLESPAPAGTRADTRTTPDAPGASTSFDGDTVPNGLAADTDAPKRTAPAVPPALAVSLKITAVQVPAAGCSTCALP